MAEPVKGTRPLFLCSADAEHSAEVHTLRLKGERVRASASAPADVLVPTPRGSLTFLLWHGSAGTTVLVRRAQAAMRASRRCTVLWVGAEPAEDKPLMTLQAACPLEVSVLRCTRSEEAVEHMRACATARPSADPVEDRVEEVAAARGEELADYLAQQWGARPHDVKFLLSVTSLAALARIESFDEYEQFRRSAAGLLGSEHDQLISAALRWLHEDQLEVL